MSEPVDELKIHETESVLALVSGETLHSAALWFDKDTNEGEFCCADSHYSFPLTLGDIEKIRDWAQAALNLCATSTEQQA
jgi:hypothetical protein